MRVVAAFITGFFVVVSMATDLRAEEVPKPKGECSGSLFQQYLREDGRKAFAYAEDSNGRYACSYAYGGSGTTGDGAQIWAKRYCRDEAKRRGVDASCRIVATDNKGSYTPN